MGVKSPTIFSTFFIQIFSLNLLNLLNLFRCLDLGFQQAMNSIIQGLPAQRQSLLFSATQTRLELQLGLVRVRSMIGSGLGFAKGKD